MYLNPPFQNRLSCLDSGSSGLGGGAFSAEAMRAGSFLKSSITDCLSEGWCSAAAGWNIATTSRPSTFRACPWMDEIFAPGKKRSIE